jgi:hypothetical protein
MSYNLDDMIKDSGATPEQIAEGVKEMDWEARITAIKTKRAEAQADYARSCGARLAEEWSRKDFQCFIKKAPQLAKLTDNELRALFLKPHGYDPDTEKPLYERATNLYIWRRARKRNVPDYDLALEGLHGEAREKEWYKIHDLWRNL